MWWSDRVYVMWMQPLRKIAEQVYAMRKIVFYFFFCFLYKARKINGRNMCFRINMFPTHLVF